MSRLGRSARPRPTSAAALAILLGGIVFVSLLVERGSESPSPPVSVAAAVLGGRRMMIRVNGGLAQRTLEEFKAGDPFSSSKRRVPNGPDPVHNRGAGESGRSPGRV